MQGNRAFIGLGSNMGDRLQLLNRATAGLNKYAGKVLHQSKIYKTPPWGFEAHQSFYNQVVELNTTLLPEPLLDILQQIEHELGRVRSGREYSSRTMDLDILFYDDKVIETNRLTIPHPHLHERNFVLVPLNEIAPDFIHPKIGKTINELLQQSPDNSECNPIENKD